MAKRKQDNLMTGRWIDRITRIHHATGWIIEHAEDFDNKSKNLREIIDGELFPFDLGEYLTQLLECDTRDALTMMRNWPYIAEQIDGLSQSEALELIEQLGTETLTTMQGLIMERLSDAKT